VSSAVTRGGLKIRHILIGAGLLAAIFELWPEKSVEGRGDRSSLCVTDFLLKTKANGVQSGYVWDTTEEKEKAKIFPSKRITKQDASAKRTSKEAIERVFKGVAEQSGMDERFIWAIGEAESDGSQYNKDGTVKESGKGAAGRMQVTPIAIREVNRQIKRGNKVVIKLLEGEKADWQRVKFDEEHNIRVGTAYLYIHWDFFRRQQLVSINGKWRLVRKPLSYFKNGGRRNFRFERPPVAAYNSGPKIVIESLQQHGPEWYEYLYTETKGHRERFLERYYKAKSASSPIVNQPIIRNAKQPNDRIPETLEDFVTIFGNDEAIKGNVNYDIIAALAAQWNEKDLEVVVRRMRNTLAIYHALAALRKSNAELLAQFEEDNPGKEAGSILNQLAEQTHTSWFNGEKQKSSYIEYTQQLHDFLARYIKLSMVKVEDGLGQGYALILGEFENPRKKFKLKVSNFEFSSDEQRIQFSAEFRKITGKNFDEDVVINTISGEWDVLNNIKVQTNPETWSSIRPEYLYGLQADAVGAVMAALYRNDLVSNLGQGNFKDKMGALIYILRIINLGWRLNNPWGGFTDRLIHRPFDLEENGGIGIEDIVKDAIVLKTILEVLIRAIRQGQVKLDVKIREGLERAFDAGLDEVLKELIDRSRLIEAVRAFRIAEDFTIDAIPLSSFSSESSFPNTSSPVVNKDLSNFLESLMIKVYNKSQPMTEEEVERLIADMREELNKDYFPQYCQRVIDVLGDIFIQDDPLFTNIMGFRETHFYNLIIKIAKKYPEKNYEPILKATLFQLKKAEELENRRAKKYCPISGFRTFPSKRIGKFLGEFGNLLHNSKQTKDRANHLLPETLLASDRNLSVYLSLIDEKMPMEKELLEILTSLAKLESEDSKHLKEIEEIAEDIDSLKTKIEGLKENIREKREYLKGLREKTAEPGAVYLLGGMRASREKEFQESIENTEAGLKPWEVYLAETERELMSRENLLEEKEKQPTNKDNIIKKRVQLNKLKKELCLISSSPAAAERSHRSQVTRRDEDGVYTGENLHPGGVSKAFKVMGIAILTAFLTVGFASPVLAAEKISEFTRFGFSIGEWVVNVLTLFIGYEFYKLFTSDDPEAGEGRKKYFKGMGFIIVGAILKLFFTPENETIPTYLGLALGEWAGTLSMFLGAIELWEYIRDFIQKDGGRKGGGIGGGGVSPYIPADKYPRAASPVTPQEATEWKGLVGMFREWFRSAMGARASPQKGQGGIAALVVIVAGIAIIPLQKIFVIRQNIEEVLYELKKNLVKAIEKTEEGIVELSTKYAESKIVISIKDTGKGISRDDLERVMRYGFSVEPEYDDESYENRKGAGIGLPLSKQIIEDHRGTFKIESRLGVGTIVTITLPIADIVVQASSALDEEATAARRKNIQALGIGSSLQSTFLISVLQYGFGDVGDSGRFHREPRLSYKEKVSLILRSLYTSLFDSTADQSPRDISKIKIQIKNILIKILYLIKKSETNAPPKNTGITFKITLFINFFRTLVRIINKKLTQFVNFVKQAFSEESAGLSGTSSPQQKEILRSTVFQAVGVGVGLSGLMLFALGMVREPLSSIRPSYKNAGSPVEEISNFCGFKLKAKRNGISSPVGKKGDDYSGRINVKIGDVLTSIVLFQTIIQKVWLQLPVILQMAYYSSLGKILNPTTAIIINVVIDRNLSIEVSLINTSPIRTAIDPPLNISINADPSTFLRELVKNLAVTNLNILRILIYVNKNIVANSALIQQPNKLNELDSSINPNVSSPLINKQKGSSPLKPAFNKTATVSLAAVGLVLIPHIVIIFGSGWLIYKAMASMVRRFTRPGKQANLHVQSSTKGKKIGEEASGAKVKELLERASEGKITLENSLSEIFNIYNLTEKERIEAGKLHRVFIKMNASKKKPMKGNSAEEWSEVKAIAQYLMALNMAVLGKNVKLVQSAGKTSGAFGAALYVLTEKMYKGEKFDGGIKLVENEEGLARDKAKEAVDILGPIAKERGLKIAYLVKEHSRDKDGYIYNYHSGKFEKTLNPSDVYSADLVIVVGGRSIYDYGEAELNNMEAGLNPQTKKNWLELIDEPQNTPKHPYSIGQEAGVAANSEDYMKAAKWAEEIPQKWLGFIPLYYKEVHNESMQLTGLGKIWLLRKLKSAKGIKEKKFSQWVDYIENTLIIRHIYRIEKRYIDGKEKLILVDSATGRALEGLVLRQGMQQALVACYIWDQEKLGKSVNMKIPAEGKSAFQMDWRQYGRLPHIKDILVFGGTFSEREVKARFGTETVSIPFPEQELGKIEDKEEFNLHWCSEKAFAANIEAMITQRNPVFTLVEDGAVDAYQKELLKRGIRKDNIGIISARTSDKERDELLERAGSSKDIIILMTKRACTGTNITFVNKALKENVLLVLTYCDAYLYTDEQFVFRPVRDKYVKAKVIANWPFDSETLKIHAPKIAAELYAVIKSKVKRRGVVSTKEEPALREMIYAIRQGLEEQRVLAAENTAPFTDVVGELWQEFIAQRNVIGTGKFLKGSNNPGLLNKLTREEREKLQKIALWLTQNWAEVHAFAEFAQKKLGAYSQKHSVLNSILFVLNFHLYKFLVIRKHERTLKVAYKAVKEEVLKPLEKREGIKIWPLGAKQRTAYLAKKALGKYFTPLTTLVTAGLGVFLTIKLLGLIKAPTAFIGAIKGITGISVLGGGTFIVGLLLVIVPCLLSWSLWKILGERIEAVSNIADMNEYADFLSPYERVIDKKLFKSLFKSIGKYHYKSLGVRSLGYISLLGTIAVIVFALVVPNVALAVIPLIAIAAINIISLITSTVYIYANRSSLDKLSSISLTHPQIMLRTATFAFLTTLFGLFIFKYAAGITATIIGLYALVSLFAVLYKIYVPRQQQENLGDKMSLPWWYMPVRGSGFLIGAGLAYGVVELLRAYGFSMGSVAIMGIASQIAFVILGIGMIAGVLVLGAVLVSLEKMINPQRGILRRSITMLPILARVIIPRLTQFIFVSMAFWSIARLAFGSSFTLKSLLAFFTPGVLNVVIPVGVIVAVALIMGMLINAKRTGFVLVSGTGAGVGLNMLVGSTLAQVQAAAFDENAVDTLMGEYERKEIEDNEVWMVEAMVKKALELELKEQSKMNEGGKEESQKIEEPEEKDKSTGRIERILGILSELRVKNQKEEILKQVEKGDMDTNLAAQKITHLKKQKELLSIKSLIANLERDLAEKEEKKDSQANEKDIRRENLGKLYSEKAKIEKDAKELFAKIRARELPKQENPGEIELTPQGMKKNGAAVEETLRLLKELEFKMLEEKVAILEKKAAIFKARKEKGNDKEMQQEIIALWWELISKGSRGEQQGYEKKQEELRLRLEALFAAPQSEKQLPVEKDKNSNKPKEDAERKAVKVVIPSGRNKGVANKPATERSLPKPNSNSKIIPHESTQPSKPLVHDNIIRAPPEDILPKDKEAKQSNSKTTVVSPEKHSSENEPKVQVKPSDTSNVSKEQQIPVSPRKKNSILTRARNYISKFFTSKPDSQKKTPVKEDFVKEKAQQPAIPKEPANLPSSAERVIDGANRTSNVRPLDSIIGDITDYINSQGLNEIPEAVVNNYLYEGLAETFGYEFYQPPEGIKSNGYFRKLMSSIRSKYADALIIEGHLNSAPGLVVFFKEQGKTYAIKIENEKIRKIEWKGEVSGILKHRAIVIEFGSLKGFFKLTPQEFTKAVKELEIILKWYGEENPYKQIVFVPGHGGLNYKSSHHVENGGGHSTGASISFNSLPVLAAQESPNKVQAKADNEPAPEVVNDEKKGIVGKIAAKIFGLAALLDSTPSVEAATFGTKDEKEKLIRVDTEDGEITEISGGDGSDDIGRGGTNPERPQQLQKFQQAKDGYDCVLPVDIVSQRKEGISELASKWLTVEGKKVLELKCPVVSKDGMIILPAESLDLDTGIFKEINDISKIETISIEKKKLYYYDFITGEKFNLFINFSSGFEVGILDNENCLTYLKVLSRTLQLVPDLFEGVKAVYFFNYEVFAGGDAKIGGEYLRDPLREIWINSFSFKEKEKYIKSIEESCRLSLLHELLEHFRLTISPSEGAVHLLYDSISWVYIKELDKFVPFLEDIDNFASQFRYKGDIRKYGMSKVSEDLPTWGTAMVFDPLMLEEVREEMDRGNYIPAIKYLTLKHLVFSGSKFDEKMVLANKGLTLQEVIDRILQSEGKVLMSHPARTLVELVRYYYPSRIDKERDEIIKEIKEKTFTLDEIVEKQLKILEDSEGFWSEREDAAILLAKMKAKGSIPCLIRVMESDSEHIKLRFTAARALGSMGYFDKEAISQLLEVFKKEEAGRSRELALFGLRVAEKTKEFAPLIYKALKDIEDFKGDNRVLAKSLIEALGEAHYVKALSYLKELLPKVEKDGLLGKVLNKAIENLDKRHSEKSWWQKIKEFFNENQTNVQNPSHEVFSNSRTSDVRNNQEEHFRGRGEITASHTDVFGISEGEFKDINYSANKDIRIEGECVDILLYNMKDKKEKLIRVDTENGEIKEINDEGDAGDIFQSLSTGKQLQQWLRPKLDQTFYSPFTLSAKIIPNTRKAAVVIVNRILSHIEPILPSTPPITAAKINPWNNVRHVLLNASNLLSVQNSLSTKINISQSTMDVNRGQNQPSLWVQIVSKIISPFETPAYAEPKVLPISPDKISQVGFYGGAGGSYSEGFYSLRISREELGWASMGM
ncbi:MAG: HEAT repeat domain-containing protein, partial [Candidatus Omnitrophica bacterium]|nr:HEAT repeat domain-containing protein [Candidatus Omnitrophota bacterium]